MEYLNFDDDGVYESDSGSFTKSYVNVVDPVEIMLNLPL